MKYMTGANQGGNQNERNTKKLIFLISGKRAYGQNSRFVGILAWLVLGVQWYGISDFPTYLIRKVKIKPFFNPGSDYY